MSTKYSYTITIEEGSDEWWESIEDKCKCEELKQLLIIVLGNVGFYEGINFWIDPKEVKNDVEV